jgi:hypothetical protein
VGKSRAENKAISVSDIDRSKAKSLLSTGVVHSVEDMGLLLQSVVAGG